MGKEQHQRDKDVQQIREVLTDIYKRAEKAGVPVAGFRENYFPNHIKQEFLDKIGDDIFKIIEIRKKEDIWPEFKRIFGGQYG